MTVLLRARNLQVAFDDKVVVHGIDFDIAAGEKVALVGESGSGKTVTALSLLRLLGDARVEGSVHFTGGEGGAGEPVDLLRLGDRALRGVRGRDIAMIFQEPMTALNPLYPIGDQIAEVLQVKVGLSRRAAWARAVDLLADTGIAEPARRATAYPHQLSGGQRQRAMIAMALACQPRLLLADEPTTALDVSLRGQILDLLDDLQRKHGMAVLMITHDLNLVRRFSQRVIVMESGHIVEQGAVDAVFGSPQHAYTRSLIASRPQRDVPDTAPDSDAETSLLLEARGLRVRYPVARPGWRGWFGRGEFVAVHQVDFELRAGQTLGVIGESGSGKSTLALAALGLLPLQEVSGELRVLGQVWSKKQKENKDLRSQVQVVFQDPFSSLSPRRTVEEIVGEGLGVHMPELDAAGRRARVTQVLAEVGLDERQFPGFLQRYPHEFSGGQRQRIAIARALAVRPRLLVLDEPTSALDVSIQKQVLELLQRLQREHGLAYLLITHDVDVIRAMAHDVLVMQAGRVVEAGPALALLDAPHDPYTQALVKAAATP
ncbi:ABC transporter ATP-binding protein [Hylemonella sp. W303a]|uniref:ABC transporter ATP-binding protein n=1 Tax=Hylemonella sp. W303a TaxID=3389873 RepID=UPI00396B1E8A